MVDEIKILDGINAKKNSAWLEMYKHFYSSLCSYSAKITKNSESAEDVVQSCFIKLWNSNVAFEDIKALVSYLYKSVYNGSLNSLRDDINSRGLHDSWSNEMSSDEESMIQLAVQEEAYSLLLEAIDSLPEMQRKVMQYTLNGKTVHEISEAENISENSVKTHKKRAYEAIRKKIGRIALLIISQLVSF